jgi:serine/threonine protein kinase
MSSGAPRVLLSGFCLFNDCKVFLELSGSTLSLVPSQPSALSGRALYSLCPHANVVLESNEKYFKVSLSDPTAGRLSFTFATRDESCQWCFALRMACVHNPSLTLDQFRVIAPLGVDDLGAVFVVEALRTSQVCSLRRLSVSALSSPSAIPCMTTFIVPDHPFVGGLVSSFVDGEDMYIQSQYPVHGCVTGCDCSFAEFQRMAGEMFLAVDACHQIGLAAGALLPENFMIDANGHVVLTELGICRKLEPTDESPYVAPEVADKGHFTFASDWWAIGAILFSIIAGAPPLIDENGISCPKYINQVTKELLLTLLSRDRKSRQRFEFKNHQFFAGIDWHALLEKRLVLPPARTPCEKHGDDDGNPPVDFFRNFESMDLEFLLEASQSLILSEFLE